MNRAITRLPEIEIPAARRGDFYDLLCSGSDVRRRLDDSGAEDPARRDLGDLFIRFAFFLKVFIEDIRVIAEPERASERLGDAVTCDFVTLDSVRGCDEHRIADIARRGFSETLSRRTTCWRVSSVCLMTKMNRLKNQLSVFVRICRQRDRLGKACRISALQTHPSPPTCPAINGNLRFTLWRLGVRRPFTQRTRGSAAMIRSPPRAHRSCPA